MGTEETAFTFLSCIYICFHFHLHLFFFLAFEEHVGKEMVKATFVLRKKKVQAFRMGPTSREGLEGLSDTVGAPLASSLYTSQLGRGLLYYKRHCKAQRACSLSQLLDLVSVSHSYRGL